jgi:hypothetical protein
VRGSTRHSTLRMLFVVGLVAAATASAAGPAGAQDRIDHRTYLERLQRASLLARRGFLSPSPRLMNEVRATLGLPVEVVVGDRTVPVPPDPLLQQLHGTLAADFRQAEERLTSLLAESRVVFGRSPPTDAELRAALRDAYRDLGPRSESLFERVRREIAEALARAVSGLFEYSGIRTILEWLAVLALILVVGRILVRGRLVPDRRVRAGRRPESPSLRDWLARADGALARGDQAEAVRALYRALLAALAARGVTSDSPSLTAGECRAAVARSRPGLYPLVADATSGYERVTFGLSRPDPATVQSLRQAALQARSA